MKSIAAALFLTALCAAGNTNRSVKTYNVQYTDPQEIAAIAPVMMSSTNGLTMRVSERKLIVRGTPEQHEVVRQMVQDLDAPPKNIQINVAFNSSGQSRQSEVGIRPRGPVVIRNGEIHGTLEGRFGSRRTSTSENTTQMLVAMDGRSATLRVGERVPYLSWLVEYGYRYGYVQEIGIEWRDVGSFLAIEPRIIGPELIRVRLIPELSGRLEDGSRQTIQFTHLATEVTAADGQPIRIGGFSKDEDFSSRFLIGTAPESRSINTTITLTPTILD